MTEAGSLHYYMMTLFLEKFGIEVPSVDTDLIDTGMIDSLAFVELLSHLEREFAVKISIEELDIDNFRSIAKIGEFMNQQTNHRPPPHVTDFTIPDQVERKSNGATEIKR
jgi:acyl carrier protein